MLKNIIADYLFSGELEQRMTLLTDKLRHLLTVVCEESDKLTASLSAAQKTLFKNYCDAEVNYRLETIDRYFSEGFKAGVLMGLEINGF